MCWFRTRTQKMLSAVISNQENIMAIGKETQAALADLNEAIVVETEQAARKIIEATNADAATADAIREALAGVKNIIPDAPASGPAPETPEVPEEPVEEPSDGDTTPVGATDQNPDGPVPGDVEEDASSEAPAPSDVPEGENSAVVEEEDPFDEEA